MPLQRQYRLSPFGYFYCNIQQWTPAKVAILPKREALACARQWGGLDLWTSRYAMRPAQFQNASLKTPSMQCTGRSKQPSCSLRSDHTDRPSARICACIRLAKVKDTKQHSQQAGARSKINFNQIADAPINPTAARDPWGAAQPRVTLVVGAGAGARGHGEVGGFEYTMLAIFCSTVGVRGKSRWLTPLISFSSKW